MAEVATIPLKLPDGRVIPVKKGSTAAEVQLIINAAMGQTPAKLAEPTEKTPKDWKEAGSLALQSLGQTAGQIGDIATHLPENVPKLDEAFGAAAKQFGEDPLGTSWGAVKGTAQGIKDSVRTGLVTTTGLVGSIPGVAQLENLPGGNPEALQAHIDEAKRNIAYRPIGTAMDTAGLVPGLAAAGRGAVTGGRVAAGTLTGRRAAERILESGMTPELAARQVQYGPGATRLDVMPPEARARALSYVARVPRGDVAPMNEALRQRELLGGERHRELVESDPNANTQPGGLLVPRAHSNAARAQSRAIQEQYTEQATRARDEAVRARNEASAARTEAARTERNRLYPAAFAQHADMPLDSFRDILETPVADKILEDFAAAEPSLAAGRGHGIGNLEKLDKLELQLSRDMENFSPGTIEWNTRRELAQQIRDRLATQFDGVPEMADYVNARLRHAEVANAPEPTEVPSRRVHMPPAQRAQLDATVDRARATERLASPTTMRNWRDRAPPDIRDGRTEHLTADLMQAGTNRERAFEQLRREMPRGIEPGTWHTIQRNLRAIIATGSTAGVASFLHSLGMPWAGAATGVASGLLGGGLAISRARTKQIGRRILERTMDEMNPPAPYPAVPNRPGTILGRRNP